MLGLVIVVEIGLFISGPKYAYDDQIQELVETIETAHPDVDVVNRHVFQYVVYVGENAQSYLFFNETGKLISERDKSALRNSDVKKHLREQYDIQEYEQSLGYGYEKPVYVITTAQRVILLDFDTLEEINDFHKEDAA